MGPKNTGGMGSSTFSLRWIRVKGMVCRSWGLLFLVSCWMGSAMSATKDTGWGNKHEMYICHLSMVRFGAFEAVVAFTSIVISVHQ